MVESRRYTADELVEGIASALAAGDVPAAHAILCELAVVDVKRADEVQTVMRAAVLIAKERRG